MGKRKPSVRLFVAACSLYALVGAAPAAEPTALVLNKDWNLDVIRLKNGFLLKGIIVEETATALRFQHVRRATGRPTVSMTTSVRRSDVDRIDRIPETERALLKGRLKELDPNGEGERRRMEGLTLESADWEGKPNAGRRYDSDYFSLISNAPEDTVRRAAVRLEQIYAAYAAFLPPRHPGGKPATIVLYPSWEEYQKMLKARGWDLQNSAFFNPDANRIVCGSNMLKLGNDLDTVRRQHQEILRELDGREAEARKYYGKTPVELDRRLQSIQELRKKIAETDRFNTQVFNAETGRLFGVLYHEAFHAYANSFVFPPKGKESTDRAPGELPRWLNEGLAQIFETAIVEAGELRVGHPDKDRLRRVREAIKKGEFPPIRDLLHAGPKAFLVRHNGDKQASDRTYLASWAVACYLTFDRRLLGSADLDEFVRASNAGEKCEAAFARLVGQDLQQFEKDFHAWLLKVPEDGSFLDPVAMK